MLNYTFHVVFSSFRVEIIRLSDKSFKETIKDAELSTYRSTTKDGIVSLDPSKPLPHEVEERNPKHVGDQQQQQNHQEFSNVNEHEAKIVSHYTDANDSVILNKTEFREILMTALNINNGTLNDFEKSHRIDDDVTASIADSNQFNNVDIPEIKPSYEHIAPSTTSPTDDIIYLNQTIEKSTSQNPLNDVQKKANPISLDTPEVDKLLNEGNF